MIKSALFSIIALFSAGAMFATSCTQQPGAAPSPPANVMTPAIVQITLHPEDPRGIIPSDFIGLSYDSPMLASKRFDVANTEFINLLNNLGKGVLSFGANGVEYTYWPRTLFDRFLYSLPFRKVNAVLSPSDLDRMFAFANKIGWRVIFGLNLGTNDPEMVADEAAYAAKVGGDSIIAFQVGNEPDLYSRNGIRKPNYSYTDFHQEFKAHEIALRNRLPNISLAGPGTATNIEWFTNFINDEAANLVFSTNHIYPLNAKDNLNPTDLKYASIENLLSATTTKDTAGLAGRFADVASKNNILLRIDETNSTYPGKDGVGDVFAAALWGADYQFDLAERGIVGANFFGGFECHGYTPICEDGGHYSAQPLYYGLLLFHLAAQGRIVPVEVVAATNTTAHAALDDNGTLRALVINKDPDYAITAVIDAGKQYSQANVIRLVAPSLNAKEGITLAGNPVKSDGTWVPGVVEQIKLDGKTCQVALPAASAAMITFK